MTDVPSRRCLIAEMVSRAGFGWFVGEEYGKGCREEIGRGGYLMQEGDEPLVWVFGWDTPKIAAEAMIFLGWASRLPGFGGTDDRVTVRLRVACC